MICPVGSTAESGIVGDAAEDPVCYQAEDARGTRLDEGSDRMSSGLFSRCNVM